VGFFEATIRYLGGTLSAYALSNDPTLLRLAERIGQMLLPAFNGTKSGLPAYSVNVETCVYFVTDFPVLRMRF
jgi:mannosyl-oligosaccharide alpha-1,2-mannosidase